MQETGWGKGWAYGEIGERVDGNSNGGILSVRKREKEGKEGRKESVREGEKEGGRERKLTPAWYFNPFPAISA